MKAKKVVEIRAENVDLEGDDEKEVKDVKKMEEVKGESYGGNSELKRDIVAAEDGPCNEVLKS